MIDLESEKGKNIIIVLLIIIIILLAAILTIALLKKDNNNIDNKNTSDIKTQEVNTLNVNTKSVDISKNTEIYKKDNSTLSKAVNKTIGGLKTHVTYSGKKALDDQNGEEEASLYLYLTGDDEFYMRDFTGAAGYLIVGTYKIENNKLILNQKYINGSDCTTIIDPKKYTFEIKDGTIIAKGLLDIELKETNEPDLKFISLLGDICEVDEEQHAKLPGIYTYVDEKYEIDLEFLLFNHYLLTYCDDKSCYSSFGTYSYDDNKIVLNQNKYQGSDVCYYKKNKKHELTYTKLSEEKINSFKENYQDSVVYFDTVNINLKDNEEFIDKEFTLKLLNEKDTEIINKLYNSNDFFRVYCGE